MKYEFSITKNPNPKKKPDPDTLRFGTEFTDHMFIMDYQEGEGWHNGRIVPYGPLSLDPAAVVFHYAQEMFEGLKAYKSEDGRVLLFRPYMNAQSEPHKRQTLHPADRRRPVRRSYQSSRKDRCRLDPSEGRNSSLYSSVHHRR